MRPSRLPIVALLAWAAIGIGFVATAASLPIDDFWLTLASGGSIIHGADLTQALPFSWTETRPGALNPQWGAQLVLGVAGSTAAALVINAFLIAIGLIVTAARTVRSASGIGAALAILLGFAAVAPYLLARAQSFSIALFPVALLLLERFGSWRLLPIAYGALIAVWANLHGAFVIGQVAAATAFVGAVIERRRPESLLLGLTVVTAFVAPLVNPVGPALLGYAYAQPALDLIRRISVEWQPAYPWIAVTWLFWAQAGLVVTLRLRRPGPRVDGEALLALALLILAASSIRHIPWFCLATAPMLAHDLAAVLGPKVTVRPSAGRRMPSHRSVAALATLAILVQPFRPLLPQGIGRVTPDAPVALAERLGAELSGQGAPARVLNEQVWGGYLVYRLGDRVQTAMDGRIEIRDRPTWQAYFDLMNGEHDPATTLAQADVRWALINLERHRLKDTLLDAGWRVVVEDSQGALLAAP